uniref:uncharacterized protein isoform X2 n=1 Tax=Myxine glutinosa TaxID=7769 RepID=UPI00358EEC1C
MDLMPIGDEEERSGMSCTHDGDIDPCPTAHCPNKGDDIMNESDTVVDNGVRSAEIECEGGAEETCGDGTEGQCVEIDETIEKSHPVLPAAISEEDCNTRVSTCVIDRDDKIQNPACTASSSSTGVGDELERQSSNGIEVAELSITNDGVSAESHFEVITMEEVEDARSATDCVVTEDKHTRRSRPRQWWPQKLSWRGERIRKEKSGLSNIEEPLEECRDADAMDNVEAGGTPVVEITGDKAMGSKSGKGAGAALRKLFRPLPAKSAPVVTPKTPDEPTSDGDCGSNPPTGRRSFKSIFGIGTATSTSAEEEAKNDEVGNVGQDAGGNSNANQGEEAVVEQ